MDGQKEKQPKHPGRLPITSINALLASERETTECGERGTAWTHKPLSFTDVVVPKVPKVCHNPNPMPVSIETKFASLTDDHC